MEKFAEVGKYVGMVFVSCNFYIFAQPHQDVVCWEFDVFSRIGLELTWMRMRGCKMVCVRKVVSLKRE